MLKGSLVTVPTLYEHRLPGIVEGFRKHGTIVCVKLLHQAVGVREYPYSRVSLLPKDEELTLPRGFAISEVDGDDDDEDSKKQAAREWYHVGVFHQCSLVLPDTVRFDQGELYPLQSFLQTLAIVKDYSWTCAQTRRELLPLFQYSAAFHSGGWWKVFFLCQEKEAIENSSAKQLFTFQVQVYVRKGVTERSSMEDAPNYVAVRNYVMKHIYAKQWSQFQFQSQLEQFEQGEIPIYTLPDLMRLGADRPSSNPFQTQFVGETSAALVPPSKRLLCDMLQEEQYWTTEQWTRLAQLNCTLFPHQIQTLRFMLFQECVYHGMTEALWMKLPLPSFQPKLSSPVAPYFRYCPYTGRFCFFDSKVPIETRGGWNCDTMGLGKTIEMLALMNLNAPNSSFASKVLETKQSPIQDNAPCLETISRAEELETKRVLQKDYPNLWQLRTHIKHKWCVFTHTSLRQAILQQAPHVKRLSCSNSLSPSQFEKLEQTHSIGFLVWHWDEASCQLRQVYKSSSPTVRLLLVTKQMPTHSYVNGKLQTSKLLEPICCGRLLPGDKWLAEALFFETREQKTYFQDCVEQAEKLKNGKSTVQFPAHEPIAPAVVRTAQCLHSMGRIRVDADLILAPTKLIGQWAEQLQSKSLRPLRIFTFAGPGRHQRLVQQLLVDKQVDVVLVGMPVLSKEKSVMELAQLVDEQLFPWQFEGEHSPRYRSLLEHIYWNRITFDEGHNLRNSSSALSHLLMNLDAKYKWICTGTPLQHGLVGLESQMRFLGPQWDVFRNLLHPFRSATSPSATENFHFNEQWRRNQLISDMLRSNQFQEDREELYEQMVFAAASELIPIADPTQRVLYIALNQDVPPVPTSSAEARSRRRPDKTHPLFWIGQVCGILRIFSYSMIHHAPEQNLVQLPPLAIQYIDVPWSKECQDLYKKMTQCIARYYRFLCDHNLDKPRALVVWGYLNLLRQLASVGTHSLTVFETTMQQMEEEMKAPPLPSQAARIEQVVSRATEPAFHSFDDDCSICLERYTEPLQTPCRHVFCKQCLMGLFQMQPTRCPSCRATLNAQRLTLPLFVQEQTVLEFEEEEEEEKLEEKTIHVRAKLDMLYKMVEELKRNADQRPPKALVFFHSSKALEYASKTVKQERVSYISILRTSMTTDQVTRVLAQFKQDPTRHLLFLPVSIGSVGFNLDCAPHVIFMDAGWSFDEEQQAIARSRRLGQQYPVMVYALRTPATIEEPLYHISLQTENQNHHGKPFLNRTTFQFLFNKF